MGLAPLVGLVSPATPPTFLSWPLLFVLAALPPLLAWVLRHRSSLAAAVLIGPAVLAPGRLIMDAQVLVDAGRAARPELLVPTSLVALKPSAGLALLLAGHVAALAAGVIVTVGRRRAEPHDPAFDSGELRSPRRGLLALVLLVSVVAAVGLMLAWFGSTDPFLLPRPALDAPPLVLIGTLLMALAVPFVGGHAASSADPDCARGELWGLAAALLAVVTPSLVAAGVVDRLRFGSGAITVAVVAVVLLGLSVPAGRAVQAPPVQELELPAFHRLLTWSGALAIGAGVLAVLAVFTPRVEMPGALADPSAYPARMLIPGAVIMVLVGCALFVPGWAARVRPVAALGWVVLPLTAAPVLDGVFNAAQAAGATAGIGAWSAGLALFVAVASGVAAAVAGAVERDDVDTTEIEWNRFAALPAGLAALAGVLAFSFPAVVAPRFTPAGLFTGFAMSSWSLVIGLLAVALTGAVAPRCRPSRGASMLAAAAVVLLVRALELPLTGGRIDGMVAATGTWAAVTGVLLFCVAAGTTVLQERAHSGPGPLSTPLERK